MSIKTVTKNDKSVQHLINHDKRLAKVVMSIGDIEYHTHDDPYEFVVMQIVGQMLSNKVAAVLNERLLKLCNGKIDPNTVYKLSHDDLRVIGLSKAKCEYISGFTCAVIEKKIDFDELTSMKNEDVVKQLTSFRGIGRWTAKMYLIFVLQREDVLPIEDGAFLQGYKWLYKTEDVSPIAITKKCKKWRPYSSIAARYLYRAVDSGLTKKEFHLYK